MSNQSCITYIGPLSPFIHTSETLDFINKYVSKVDSMDLSGPFHNWYASSAQFYSADGVKYSGGDTIWEWMRKQFGQFEKVQHDMKITRILRHATGNEFENRKTGELVMFDCVTKFWIGGGLKGEGIAIPRMLSFLVGVAEEDGEGTDGLQIHEAKVWWDTGVLGKEITKRTVLMNEKM